jgi:hypothetical protein
MKNTEQPAFPPIHDPNTHAFGLTKREYFAAMAMQGLLSLPFEGMAFEQSEHGAATARKALKHADALLAELEKERA